MFWKIGQGGAVAAILLLIVGAFLWPTVALPWFWNLVVPLVPLSLLIAPGLWRGVCPLVTANTATNGLVARKRLLPRSKPYLQAASLSLLFLLIPARRFLLNENGIVLGILLIALLVFALAVGSVFDSKAGFCNSICPVLPVEKLYGQRPLVELENVRCSTCELCTAKGCFDLAPDRSAIVATGNHKNDSRWIFSGFGVFALSFPGLIFGYFQVTDVAFSEALGVYLTVFSYAATSFIIFAALFSVSRVKAGIGLPVAAAAAIALYYWFAALSISGMLGGGSVLAGAVRVLTFGTIGYWLFITVRDRHRNQNHHHAPPATAMDLPVVEAPQR